MPTSNQNLPARTYTKEYLRTLSTVYGNSRAFDRAFQELQILDGIKQNATAFTVKTSNIPVVIGNYDTNANVGMGTGTAKSSRFGEMTEVIYTDTDVAYDYLLKTNEALDITTVNNDLDDAVEDRLVLTSDAQTRYMNTRHGAYISSVAGNSVPLASLGNDDVLALFNAMSKYRANKGIIVPMTAYLKPELYNAVIDHPLVSSGKGSAVDIDRNRLILWKDFALVETPEQYFAAGDIAYFVPDGALVPFVGVVATRAIQTPDFIGVALQSLAKGGAFTLADNAKAISKATFEEVSG